MLLRGETVGPYGARVNVSATNASSDPDEVGAIADRAGVEFVSWPQDDHLRRQYARAGVPRLLLVAPDAAPPTDVGLDEDWVRLPADRDDVLARLARLARVMNHLQDDHPVLDPSHIVHYGGASVVLSAAQATVVRLLLAHPGAVVERRTLEAALWPDGAPGPKALDGVVFRLRRRLAGMGLVVRSAHARGFAIDVQERAAAG